MIELEEVTYAEGKTLVFDRVSYQIRPGTIHCLSGKNSVGKSTFLRLITHHIAPQSGTLRFFHYVLKSLDLSQLALHRQQIGWITQQARFLEELTVQENLELFARIRGKATVEIAPLLQTVAEQLDIAPYLALPIHEVSPGIRQLVQVGRVLIQRPLLILADEPTQFLGKDLIKKIQKLLFELSQNWDVTTLVTTTWPEFWGSSHFQHCKIENHQIISS